MALAVELAFAAFVAALVAADVAADPADDAAAAIVVLSGAVSCFALSGQRQRSWSISQGVALF